jgi:hypothetical protein
LEVKARLHSLFALVAFIGGSAHGVVIPGWERPSLRAPLDQIGNGGVVINHHLKKSLTQNRRDGARRPTSYTLSEEVQVFCVKAPCPPMRQTRVFRIQSERDAGCGSRQITAVEQAPAGLTDFPAATLKVVDHSKRLCDDFRPYAWEVTVQSRREKLRRFGGNPEPVYTIMSN